MDEIYIPLFGNQQQMLSKPSHKLFGYDILQTNTQDVKR